MALFACIYFAALQPREAVALRRQDCHLPRTGWGWLLVPEDRGGREGGASSVADRAVRSPGQGGPR
jgi:hypothetical protein